MSALAAAGATWGVSGPTFLVSFLGLAALIIVGTMVHRGRLVRVRHGGGRPRLSPEQAAYLNGGEKLAVYSALGGLRAAGAIGLSPDGTLSQTGSLPAGATQLEQAMYHAAGNRVRPKALAADHWVAAALADLGSRLERDGLVLSQQARRASRIGPLLLLALVAVGLLRLIAGLAAGRSVGFLVLALLVVAPIAVVQLLRLPRRTRAGDAALTALRSGNRHLSPSRHPSYPTYGMKGAALGIALFGTASLWAVDPVFASGAGVQRHFVGGDGGGGSWGGGSSCGGGSSGSCGGGSCGGGGGCGG